MVYKALYPESSIVCPMRGFLLLAYSHKEYFFLNIHRPNLNNIYLLKVRKVASWEGFCKNYIVNSNFQDYIKLIVGISFIKSEIICFLES